ncbi:MAG TPA: DinB family protein [Candidatus Acidoferrum sp.]|nr:DinB family protein [Candidatus Acidoferrum sp.]
MSATTSLALNSELAEYARQIAELKDQAAALLRGLGYVQYNWRPAADSWSMAQCIAHIVLTDEIYIPVLGKCVVDARARGLLGSGPFRHGRLGNWFVRSMDAPAKRRFKNPKQITPREEQTLAAGLANFNVIHDHILLLVKQADGVNLSRAKFRTPFLKLLKLSLGQGIAVMLAHGRRHLWQASEVRKRPDFPKN